ncbi:RDD family protein [Actinocrispum wychmicini]|uniref:Putative RDD family membrane protein YckC n=1 Tax=Actinocrispum wychmicini TaxID=1213861 RepID=A0A4R2JQG1_9PSEU|nr:putative RDD family membrane protein YckC [Actinocrispum wychmicini]
MSDLVSGEAVVLELRVARVASRGLAMALDVLIQGFTLWITLLLLILGGLIGFDSALSAAVTLLTIVLVVVGYPVIMETLTRGRTVGKIALGLRVVRVDGGPIRFRQALVRGLAGFFVDFWALGVLGAVAVIVSMSSKKGQRVGDMLAGTLVIRERVPEQRVPYVVMPPPLAAWASELHVAALPNDLALAVRQYLGRVHELRYEAAASLGYRLAVDVSNHLGAPIPPGVPPYDYLIAVLAERRNREMSQQMQPPPVAAPPPQEFGPDSPFAPPS